MTNSKKILRILIPIIMLCIVCAIWILQSKKENEDSLTKANNNDFPLTITSIDMDELSKHKLPIIIDFGSDDCVPCKKMKPDLVDLNNAMQGKAIVHFIDVWENPAATKDFPVQIIPTQIFVTKDGLPYVPSEEISSAIGFTRYTDGDKNHIFTSHEGGLSKEQMLLILKDMNKEE